ncbi:MAG: hypothetical protein ACRDL7_02505, partial [Gaiellaceae bacterium]
EDEVEHDDSGSNSDSSGEKVEAEKTEVKSKAAGEKHKVSCLQLLWVCANMILNFASHLVFWLCLLSGSVKRPSITRS